MFQLRVVPHQLHDVTAAESLLVVNHRVPDDQRRVEDVHLPQLPAPRRDVVQYFRRDVGAAQAYRFEAGEEGAEGAEDSLRFLAALGEVELQLPPADVQVEEEVLLLAVERERAEAGAAGHDVGDDRDVIDVLRVGDAQATQETAVFRDELQAAAGHRRVRQVQPLDLGVFPNEAAQLRVVQRAVDEVEAGELHLADDFQALVGHVLLHSQLLEVRAVLLQVGVEAQRGFGLGVAQAAVDEVQRRQRTQVADVIEHSRVKVVVGFQLQALQVAVVSDEAGKQ